MTLAAVAAVRAAQTVAYPVARPGASSMAATIAAAWIRDDHCRLPLVFPMVADPQERRTAWRDAAEALLAEVRRGHSVVLLCEGDSSLFATTSYVLLAIQALDPGCAVAVIPGVSSVSAAAAAGGWPLALQQDQLLLRPCPEQPDLLEAELRAAVQASRVLALFKLGHRWSWVRGCLERHGLLHQALFAERVGWPDQLVCSADQVAASERPYFSMLLIRQHWPDTLP